MPGRHADAELGLESRPLLARHELVVTVVGGALVWRTSESYDGRGWHRHPRQVAR